MKWTTICVLMCLSTGVQAQTIVAQLTKASGGVKLERGGKVIEQNARTREYLLAGDILTLAPKAQAHLLYLYGTLQGERFSLQANSKVRIANTKVQSLKGNAPVAVTPNVPKNLTAYENVSDEIRNSPLGSTGVRGDDGKQQGPCNPFPRGAVSEEKIVLRWEGGDKALTLTLVELGSDAPLIQQSLRPRTRSYELTEQEKTHLKQGTWYFWRVKSKEGAGECGMPIRIAPAQEAETLVALEKSTAALRQKMPKDHTPDLLLAQQYERLGYFDKAAEAYEAAMEKSPKDEGIIAALKRLQMP